jgi:peptidoglycan/LPS O-acetylase OafA/YrhL
MCGFIGLSYSPSAVVVGLTVILPVLFNGAREPVTAFIGRMSYSVFLFHMPIGFQVAPRLVKVFGANNPAVFFLMVGIVLVCCWVLHHVVELPLQRVAQRVRYGKYRRREVPVKTSSESVGKRISKSFEALKIQVSDPAGDNGLFPAGPELSSRTHPPKR